MYALHTQHENTNAVSYIQIANGQSLINYWRSPYCVQQKLNLALKRKAIIHKTFLIKITGQFGIVNNGRLRSA